MTKGKTSTKHAASKLKASQKPQAHKSSGQPKKGTRCQKRPASDGSDDADSSKAEPEGPRARLRKKSRHVDRNGKKNEEEVEEENEEEVEIVADRDDDAQSEDVEEVSSV